MAQGASVELIGLRKVYGDVVALDALSLEVKQGEFVTLLGPSGSGKTTTLMMVAGFEEPTEGTILVSGQPIVGRPPYRRNVGVVFQSYALFPHMTVAGNIAYPLRMRHVPRDEIARRVADALTLMRLDGLGERYPVQLSGGQQQRVALARALVFEPPLLLMDEPLGALDKRLREDLQLEIKRVHREVGVTVLYVTHDQSEALTLSHRIAIIRDGRLEQYGTAEELYECPATPFVARFVGEATLLEGRVTSVTDEDLLVTLADGTTTFRAARRGPAGPGRRVRVVLRPEKLRLVDGATGSNTFGAVVADVTYLGDATKYWVRTRSGAIVVLKSYNRLGAARPGTGNAVYLSVDRRDVIVVPEESGPTTEGLG